MTSAIVQRKQRARRDALKERARLARLPWAPSSPIALASVFAAWLDRHPHVRHVAGYAAVRSELDCTPALLAARRRGCHTLYPRVRRDAGLDFIPVTDELSQLRLARWGLREPCGLGVPLSTLDVILVPGLRFDRYGGRLGFGGGYYDRVLAWRASHSPQAVLCGVCEMGMLDMGRLPIEPHDQRVDAVMTPDGIISCV
jgi:5-formyltetrahydrofolate cyclo-ligase